LSLDPELAEVLHKLAGQLADETLTAIFPEQEAAAVRASIREAARLLARRDGSGSPDCRAPIGALPAEETPAPGFDKLALYTDGAARGNPGEAGAGILLLDEQGREIAAKGIYLGRCTNNVAEYRALVLGLQEAGRHTVGEIAVHLDAELIVRQLLGSYRVKDSKLKPLHAQVMALLDGFSGYRIIHLPRHENVRADQLANMGIDRKER
jgi:ribonuclease HI